MKISVSLMATKNWLNLEDELLKIEKAKPDYLHIDVMDGHFVPNITFGTDLLKAVSEESKIPLDIHLMVSCLDVILPKMIDLKPEIIYFHQEAAKEKTLDYLKGIKSKGIKAGLALSPNVGFETILPYVEFLDCVLVMTVYPGFSGQKFLKEPLNKIKLIKAHDLECFVDGGVNASNIKEIEAEGADCVIMGSGFFDA